MGSPESEDGNKTNNIDPRVGGLVWVRRRNGSWWPGRILGLDEVSEGSLVSPKAGTPVKLLGRDDASVDWYNLEKSKRVKAFRCGEYNECIEKAKASAAISGKKAVKYARREDAILHALEIESERLGKDHPDYWIRPDNSFGDCALEKVSKGSSIMPHLSKANKDMTEERSDSEDALDSAPELAQSGIYFEELNHNSASKVQRKRRKTPNDSEDDGTEGTKRMKGLEDLGMGVVLRRIKQESVPFGDSNNSSMSNGDPTNGNGGNASSMRRKRSQVANIHESLRRKNRRRPLTKVLESTVMVSIPVVCDGIGCSNNSTLGGLSDESRRSFPTVGNYSEGTVGSCEIGVSLNASENAYDASDGSQKLKENEITSASDLADKSRLFDVPLVRQEKKHSAVHVSSSGKPQFVLGRQSSQSSQAAAISLKNEGLNESGSTSSAAVHVDYNMSQRMEKGTSKWQSKGKRNSRHTSKNRKSESRKYMDIMDGRDATFLDGSDQKLDYDGIALSPRRSIPFRPSRFTVHAGYQMSDYPIRNYCLDSSLFDVEVEVNASYRPQDVPLVSLMSKLNGKAIVGHPLTVEVMSDGYFDGIETNDATIPVSVAAFDAEIGYSVKQISETGGTSSSSKRVKSRSRRSLSKSSSKLRKNGLLSKKIRKLSSLTVQQEKKPVLEKPSSTAVISCIPVKLAFSRLKEALNVSGSGSVRPGQRSP